jgi:hypothetical protein
MAMVMAVVMTVIISSAILFERSFLVRVLAVNSVGRHEMVHDV